MVSREVIMPVHAGLAPHPRRRNSAKITALTATITVVFRNICQITLVKNLVLCMTANFPSGNVANMPINVSLQSH